MPSARSSVNAGSPGPAAPVLQSRAFALARYRERRLAAVLVDDAGRVLASSTEAHAPFDSPETGWVCGDA
jgi:hypothetical protein